MKLFLRSFACATRGRQLGLSLIELMIAITLGMLIVAAVLALYLNISSANNELTKVNSQIENGRFAIQLLENDVVHAGFWGSYVPQFDDLTQAAGPDVPTAVPDPCLAYNAANWNTAYLNNLIGIPVQAYDTAAVCGGVITSEQANTDVLVARHADTCVPGVGNCELYNAGKLYFQRSLSSNPPCVTESAYQLATGATITGTPLHNRDCATVADMRKFISNIYYVRNYSVTPGDGIPTLVRSQFDLSGGTLAHQAAQPLIEGIEGFRVELGVDNKVTRCGLNTAVDYTQPNDPAHSVNPLTCAQDADENKNTLPKYRGDSIPDTYVHCSGAVCDQTNLPNVVAVKMFVLARANSPTPGYSDTKTYTLGSVNPLVICSTAAACPNNILDPRYKRHVFSTTVRLNNVSGRRETP